MDFELRNQFAGVKEFEDSEELVIDDEPCAVDDGDCNEEIGDFENNSSDGEIFRVTKHLSKKKEMKKCTGRRAKVKKDDEYSKYNYNDIVFFISSVSERPALWDGSSTGYHRDDANARLWNEIEKECSEFMPRGRWHGKTAFDRWKEIKKDYIAYKNRVKNAPSGSSQIKKPFIFANHLDFLQSAIEKRAVKNAWIVGSGSSDCGTVHKTSPLSIGRKPKSRPASSTKTSTSATIEKLAENDTTLTQALLKLVDKKSNGESAEACESRELCSVFKQHTQAWSSVAVSVAKAKTITFITELQEHGNFPRAKSATRLPPNLLDDFTLMSNATTSSSNPLFSPLSEYNSNY
uniref:MADF domain-containing protein n=1 Tax=Caenorhabditis japonica TaxID=281687 RepID=A0A8R1I5L9_CAEJA